MISFVCLPILLLISGLVAYVSCMVVVEVVANWSAWGLSYLFAIMYDAAYYFWGTTLLCYALPYLTLYKPLGVATPSGRESASKKIKGEGDWLLVIILFEQFYYGIR